MVSLRNACIRLTNRYWLAQGLTLLLLGCPALAMRFENVRLGLLLGTCALAVLAINTWIAHMRWRQITCAWAHGEALAFRRDRTSRHVPRQEAVREIGRHAGHDAQIRCEPDNRLRSWMAAVAGHGDPEVRMHG